jgi:lactobin A/cerein 7B family class IIb bacteriocin
MKELTLTELESTEGGIIPFLVVGAALLLAGCGTRQTNNNANGSRSINVNCCNCNVIINGDTVNVSSYN